MRNACLSLLALPLIVVVCNAQSLSSLSACPKNKELDETHVRQVSEGYFKLGEACLQDGKPEGARVQFDRAVDTIPVSGIDVRDNTRLELYNVEASSDLERVQDTSVLTCDPDGALPPDSKLQEQAEEPSHGNLSTLELTREEKRVSADDITKAEKAKSVLDFNFTFDPLVQGFINYYQGRGRATMETGLRRSGQYMQMARKIFREEGVPEDIVWLGQVESAWRPTARSWAAASGLWQLIPGTGARFGLRQTAYVDERNSFEKATRASARYLKWLHNRFGNWELAMAAYKTGESAIDRAIAQARVANFWAIRPYVTQETRNYVPAVLATAMIAENPEKYGFHNVQRMSPLAYDTVSVPSATSFNLISALTDTSIDYIRSLNPEIRRDVTPPTEAFSLRVPPKRGHQLVTLLKRIPADRRSQMARVVQAAPGENWNTIAERTGVSVASLQLWNAGVDLTKGDKIIVFTGSRIVPTSKSYERPDSVQRFLPVGLQKNSAPRRPRRNSNPEARDQPRASNETTADPVTTALTAAINSVEKGEIVFQPAQEMIVGEAQRVEIAIAKRIKEEVAKQIGKGNKVDIESITIGAVMKAQLRGDNFDIKQISEERQVLKSEDASEQLGGGPSVWVWDVMPIESGNQRLTLTVDVRAPVPGYSGEMALYQRVFDRTINVRVNRTYTMKKFLNGNWQYFLTGLGGVVTSVFAFFFGQYWKSREETKKVAAKGASGKSQHVPRAQRHRR